MRSFLVSVGIVLSLLVTIKPREIAITPVVQPTQPVGQILATSTINLPANLPALVRGYSIQFGINPVYSSCIVSHESQWDPTKPGDDGNSRGLWQISKIWHPEVSDSEANNPVSSTLWSLAWIKSGHAEQWSTYWEYCSSTPIFE